MRNRIIKIIGFLGSFIFFSLISASSCLAMTNYHLPGWNESWGFESYISALYKLGLGTAGVLAMIVLIIAGIKYMTAAGSTEREKDAKNKIINVLFGLGIILLAYLILYTINPSLVHSKLPNINKMTEEAAEQGKTFRAHSSSCSSQQP